MDGPNPEELAAWIEQALTGFCPVSGKNADHIRAIAATLRSQAVDLKAMERQVAIVELAADIRTIFHYCEKCRASVQKDSGAACRCVVESLTADRDAARSAVARLTEELELAKRLQGSDGLTKCPHCGTRFGWIACGPEGPAPAPQEAPRGT